LRILATSDLHMHLRGFNYAANIPDTRNGLARLSTLITKARTDAPIGSCLLLDNGDALQGTALADTLRTQPDQHPLAMSFNALGYDAIGLGNHDFDFGVEYLARVLAQYDAPVVSTNLHDTGLDTVQPWVILQRDMQCEDDQIRPLNIGILSILPPQTLIWNHGQFPQSAEIEPMIAAAKLGSATLKSMGADVVILLAHSGIGSINAGLASENVALRMAAIDNIDAIIAGHTHDVFPDLNAAEKDRVDHHAGTFSGTPAAMPGFGGSHLAQIDLQMSHVDGRWQVQGHQSAAIPAQAVPEDEYIRDISKHVHGKTLARMASTIGMIAVQTHSCFSMIKTGAELQLLAHATARAISYAAVGTPYEGLPILSAVAPAASGGQTGPSNFLSVPKGTVQYRHILQLCPFEDDVWAAEVSGAELCDWLERSAAIYTTLDPNAADQSLLLSGVPQFNYDTLFGLSYTIDPTQPAKYLPNGDEIHTSARRVKDIKFKGKPLDKNQKFLVAATNFRIAGGARFPNLSPERLALHSGMTIQNALMDFVKDPNPRVHPPSGNWQIKTATNCSAVFDTSPNAMDYMDELAEYAPENMGLTDTGFQRLRLHF
jgi:2',3'-cyclic-nucleotide 2'-phosphodiesterase/3'-nucleotidase